MSKVNPKATASAKAKALLSHDYCAPEDMETGVKGTKNTLTSPMKSPAPLKKVKPDGNVTDESNEEQVSNATILAAVNSLQKMIIDLRAEIQQNTLAITNLNKAVEFNSAEIQEQKEKIKGLEKEVVHLNKANTVLERKTSELEIKAGELERYKRRWNLRLNGLKEEKGENTRDVVVNIIQQITPHWKDRMDFILDSVHRLGSNTTIRPRQIIMQFTGRIHRDELWRATKNHPVCRELHIRFAEDLTKEDREARMAVWPKVEQARKEGHKTMFRGPFAFINGQRVTP